MYRDNTTNLFSSIIALMVIIIPISMCSVGVSEATEFEDTITVEKTWTKMQCDGEGSCSERYLVRATSGEVFQITDSLYRAQFRSSDLWSQMSPGETYQIRGDGYRFGCTSSYRRIFSANLVN